MEARTIFKPWKIIFLVILALGAYATVVRFTQGLGAATNLSDSFPWGLWIGFDILVGVGLAAGGFVIAATVHIFQMEKYEPIARPTILTAFLGYVLVIVALMYDLGRPYRIWHPLVMGNPHSVMFEVAICVMLYTTVLALEFSPILFARLNWQKPLKVVRVFYLPLVIAGVLLSTLHQSSLGTMYVIVPDKLYGLWYTPLLPVFFFLSAVAAGLAMTIFESFMSARAFGKRLEPELLEGMARVIVVVLAVLLVWRFMDLSSRNSLHLAFSGSPESVMFWGEIALGVALPMLLFASSRIRASDEGLLFGALLTIMGFIMNRLNIAVTGMARSSGVNYFPSWMEFAVTASIVAIGFLLFNLAVKYLDIFPRREIAEGKRRARVIYRPVLLGRPIAALWGLLVVGTVLFGATRTYEHTLRAATGRTLADVSERGDPAAGRFCDPDSSMPADEAGGVPPGTPLHLIDGLLLPVSDESPGQVVFDHTSHVDRKNPCCNDCHAGTFPILPGTSRTAHFYGHDAPDGHKTCDKCHNGQRAFDWQDDCEMCHRE